VFTSTVTKNQQKKEEQHFQIKVLPKHVSFTLSILLLDLVFPRFPLNQQKAIRCIFFFFTMFCVHSFFCFLIIMPI